MCASKAYTTRCYRCYNIFYCWQLWWRSIKLTHHTSTVKLFELIDIRSRGQSVRTNRYWRPCRKLRARKSLNIIIFCRLLSIPELLQPPIMKNIRYTCEKNGTRGILKLIKSTSTWRANKLYSQDAMVCFFVTVHSFSQEIKTEYVCPEFAKFFAMS